MRNISLCPPLTCSFILVLNLRSSRQHLPAALLRASGHAVVILLPHVVAYFATSTAMSSYGGGGYGDGGGGGYGGGTGFAVGG